jgi:predicted AAA+ superfamily ATPase
MNFIINHLFAVNLTDSIPFTAQLLENSVIQCLISQTGSIRNIFSYKSNNKITSELDFVAVCNNSYIPVEVKLSARVNQKSLSQMLQFLKYKNLPAGIVVFTGMPGVKQIDNRKIFYLPPYFMPLVSTVI